VTDARWYLKKIPLLADLPADLMARLAEIVEMRPVRRREVIYLPGDPGHSVYFLNGGRVKVSKVTRDGKELTLAYRAPGEIFGEACLIDGAPREEMVEAMENAQITELPRGELEKIAETHPKVGYRLAKIVLQRRRDVENKIEQLLFKDVNAKLAELLLRLSVDFGVEDERGTLVGIKITHQEMANLIGSTRETVSLTLSMFKKKGLIDTDGRKVIVADAQGLRALA
jgi:CRP/FNR family cyclic AMP-dependent transcriptional regulator